MVEGISSGQSSNMVTMMQGMPRKSPEEMFKQLSTDAGGDGTSITKDQLQSYVDKLKEEGKDTKPLDDMLSNFDKISNGSDKITSSDVDTAMKNGTLKAPEKPGAQKSDSSTGKSSSTSDSSAPSEQQLRTYLNQLRSSGHGDSDIAADIQNTLNGETVIPALTTDSIKQAIQTLETSNPEEESHLGTITDTRV